MSLDMVREKNSFDPLPRINTYDAADHLTARTDRLARKREFGYDLLHRQTSEVWRNPAGALLRTLTFSFDAGDNLLTAQHPDSSYTYTYDLQGRALTVDNLGTPLSPRVQLAATYLADGLRATLQATVNVSTPDFQSSYAYDGVSRLTSVQQGPQPGQTNVAAKRVDLAYNALDQYTRITRYKDLAGTMEVVRSNFGYESQTMQTHRLASIVHQAPAMAARSYSFVWDGNDRLRTFGSPDGSSTYDYDRSDQLSTATHTYQAEPTYSYDKNGNRTDSMNVPGPENRLASDSQYTYEYDAEGNRTVRRRAGERWEYEWDHRNRLTRVRLRPDVGGTIQQEFTYTYDLFDRRIGKSVDNDGPGGSNPPVVTRFVYDGPHIALAFGGTATAPKNRYLHGAAVDQVFADEQVSGGGPGTVYWPTTDHLGTARDLLDSSGAVVKHLVYDSFGKRVTDTAPAIDFLFSFTGREWDPEAGLYYYRARYYDPAAHVFTSEDPIADDSNPYRYVGNGPTTATDPSGLVEWYDFTIVVPIAEIGYGLFWKIPQEKMRGAAIDRKRWQMEQQKLIKQATPKPSVGIGAPSEDLRLSEDARADIERRILDDSNSKDDTEQAGRGVPIGIPFWANRFRALTKERIVELWKHAHPNVVIDQGVQSTIGNDFEKAALKGIGYPKNSTTFPSPRRAAASGKGSVKPEVVLPLIYTPGLTPNQTGPPQPIVFPDSVFIDVKAVGRSISLGYDDYQILGFIDAASRSRAKQGGEVPRVVFLTTWDTRISPRVLAEATKEGVAIWQAFFVEDTLAAAGSSNITITTEALLNPGVYGTPGKDWKWKAAPIPNLIWGSFRFP